MADLEEGQPRKKMSVDQGDEAAAARLWAVYVSEAEKYDKALVQSWKSDMEGLLIFAALFSAILATFLMESYKTLNSDSGDLTVQLLAELIVRLDASANGTSVDPRPPPSFTPAATSIVCNALWFMSLGLSLACALIATLVQQWAREFLHKADMRSAPVIRAHIFSYLYYGLKRFQMHTVVEVIPLLLHTSLLLFFCGLVSFLIPVNIAMAAIACAILIAVVAVYSTLTFLPLWYLDCPYRTPLSGAFWRGLQILGDVRHRWHLHADKTGFLPAPRRNDSMVEAMCRVAVQPSDERTERDQRALIWTMKSLSDDMELEPFVEAIPDLLWGPAGRRCAYEDQIRRLTTNPNVLLHHRIGALLSSCSTGTLSLDATKRRRITCYKALWAIARLSSPWNSTRADVAVDYSSIYNRDWKLDATRTFDSDVDPYIPSALALMQWSTFGSVRQQLIDIRDYLEACLEDASSRGIPDLPQIASTIHAIEAKFTVDAPHKILYRKTTYRSSDVAPDPSTHATVQIRKIISHIDQLLSVQPYRILFEYLAQSTQLLSTPYHWDETRAAMALDASIPLSVVQPALSNWFHPVMSVPLHRLNAAADISEIAWIDTSISILLSVWKPDAFWERNKIYSHSALLKFLNERRSDKALRTVLANGGRCELFLWSSFPSALADYDPSSPIQNARIKDFMTAMWRLASLGINQVVQWKDSSRLACLETAMNALSEFGYFSHISISIMALIRNQILDELSANPGDMWSTLRHPIFQETPTQIPDPVPKYEGLHFGTRVTEASLGILAYFLERCIGDDKPYAATETLARLNTPEIIPRAAIHSTQQVRFANAIHQQFALGGSADLWAVIVELHCWDVYCVSAGVSSISMPRLGRWSVLQYPWLEDSTARNQIQGSFATYEAELTSAGETSPLLFRLRQILQGLRAKHPEPSAGETAVMGELEGPAR
ncbi:hypothetical protein DFH06DRAFT_1050443 [Mycena polygramma]|nr:hypothetical protein DFH06DRAFT_1050443 [Mycena polygramma]